jgi:tetratricopeptide (TPR) repeat protein
MVRLELADCHIKLRQYDAAMENLGQCTDSTEKMRLTARCLMNLGVLDDARQLAKRLLKVDSNNLKTLDLNAEIALIDGDVDHAIELLRAAVKVDPFDHGARTRLAQVAGRLGLEDEHNQQAKRAKELQDLWLKFSDLQVDAINRPTDANLRLQIGSLARQLGKEELALTWFRAAVAIDPNMASTVQSLVQPK